MSAAHDDDGTPVGAGDGKQEPRRFFVKQRRFLWAACRWVFGVGKVRDVLHPKPSMMSPSSRDVRRTKPFLVDAQATEAWRSISAHYADVPFHAVKRSSSSIHVASPTKRHKADQGDFPPLSGVRSNHIRRAAFLPNFDADPVRKPAKPLEGRDQPQTRGGCGANALRPRAKGNRKLRIVVGES